MEWTMIALIAVSAVLLIVVVAWIISTVIGKRKKDGDVVDGVYVKKDTRYTKNDEVTDKQGNVRISLNEGDIVLDRDQTYLVAKGSGLLPGKYTVLVSDENTKEVKIRVAGIVRTYSHNSSIVLAEGDEVCAVSTTVILR